MAETAAVPSPAVLLELAGRDYRHAGSLERAIAEELGISSTRFWLEVSRLVADPPVAVAVEWAPTIARIRRRQQAGQRQRVRG